VFGEVAEPAAATDSAVEPQAVRRRVQSRLRALTVSAVEEVPMSRLKAFRSLITFLIVLLVSPSIAQAQLPRASPEAVGLSPQRLERIGRVLQADVDAGQIPGAVIAISRKGKLVYFKAIGYRDKVAGLAMTADTLFDLTSMTKPMVSIGALMLYEQGLLFLNDPVSKYLPPLGKMPVAVLRANPATGTEEAVMRVDPATGQAVIETVPVVRPMTIQDLLRHTSGLTYGVMGDTAVHKLYPSISYDVPGLMTDTEFVDKLGTLPLLHQPGTSWDYGFSTDVLGLVIERVTKETLGEYLKQNLFRPLGMADTCFLVSGEQARRYAKPLPIDPVTGKPQSILDLTKPLKFGCGGACAAATAGDYLRFVQMLLNGGSLGATRILGRKAVESMTADQLGSGVTNNVVDIGSEYADYGFGLGVAVRLHTGIASSTGSVGDYNWLGAYGTQFWVDPKEKLAAVFLLAARGPTVLRYRQLIRTLVLQSIVD
jgi:CubicO group peptidase (beta-lactamase class C family)